ncbi:MAG: hypothetical protein HRT64_08900 [Erythrobacter sp.]|nr:hypothetical protein [Erythrobacter sp.]
MSKVDEALKDAETLILHIRQSRDGRVWTVQCDDPEQAVCDTLASVQAAQAKVADEIEALRAELNTERKRLQTIYNESRREGVRWQHLIRCIAVQTAHARQALQGQS